MGDRVWWFYDCPKCKTKDGVECYEQLTSNLKTESCNHCDFNIKWNVTDKNNVITVTKVQPTGDKHE